MDHRKTPSRRAFVPPAWFIVTTLVVCLAAAGWLGWILVDLGTDDEPSATPTSATSATPPPATDPTADPVETSAAPPPTDVERTAGVSVLNNTSTAGLATTFAQTVEAAGWPDVAVGNWRGSIGANTIYFPTDLQEQARLLSSDLGFDRVLPRVDPMRTDRLTVILSGPQ